RVLEPPGRRAPLQTQGGRAGFLPGGVSPPHPPPPPPAPFPPHFTLTATLRQAQDDGGMFLWHFPSSCPDRTLSCTLPDGARTFLGAQRERRDGPASSASDSVHERCGSSQVF